MRESAPAEMSEEFQLRHSPLRARSNSLADLCANSVRISLVASFVVRLRIMAQWLPASSSRQRVIDSMVATIILAAKLSMPRTCVRLNNSGSERVIENDVHDFGRIQGESALGRLGQIGK